MADKIIKNKIFIISLLATVIVASVAHMFLNIKTAKKFDQYYFHMLLLSTCLYSIISNANQIKYYNLVKQLVLIGVSFSIISSIVYYIYDNLYKYFSFEMEGYTWVGLYGLIRIIIYLTVTMVVNSAIWYFKFWILKIMGK